MSLLWGGGQYRDLASSEDLSAFASAIATMTKEAQKDDSEEFQKNVIAQFLSTTFDYVCNTRGKVDLAIYDDDIPKVLFEVKSLSNKAEFVKSPQNQTHAKAPSAREGVSYSCHTERSEVSKSKNIDLNHLDYLVDNSTTDSRNDRWGLESKAFYESILYYLREFKAHKNNNIKHIILCTAHEFYFINAKAYHKLFVSNADKAIQKRIDTAYNNCGKKQGTGNDTSTSKFYAEIEAILPDIDATLEFCYVNVANLANNKGTENPRDLALLYALLSPNFLLQIPRYIDANTLNERFYKELLYILGLVQIEQEGKALILPSTTPNTLLHSIKRDFADKLPQDLSESQNPSDSNALDSRQNALDSDDLAQSHKGKSTQNPSHPQDSQNPSQDSKHPQNPNDSQTSHDSADIFDSHIFPLIMLWNNRILFLRLLESMLLSFRHIDKPFLDISILRDFGALNVLFFKVLAVKNRTDIPPNLAEIPYLNSSLFEKSALELQGFEIATLESRPLKIAPDSILRRNKTLRDRYIGKDECLPLLEYLFAFLHAYDFTTTPSDVQNYAKTNHDKLINSAVLGLVFEKLNGYKEGSFYTPSFITRYMCESSIRKIVVEKFQERGFKAQSLIALRNEIDINKLNDANKIFLSIRICDPAVGSGHFLVSALNELIAIKHELGLLLDCDGRRLSDIDLVLENDELLIKDSLGNALDYRIPAHERIEAHKIQKAIFYTKKEIIENCLFGVDINPNSVEICKLRLWIELLKYSYYENIATKELQTLPNIDINIKCGNSLISRFDLHNSLKHIPNINKQIKDYQKLVLDYKHSNQSELKASKKDIESKITNLKETFKLTLKDPKTKASLEKAINNHIAHYGFYLLDDESILAGLNGGFHRLFGNEMSLSEKEQESALESYANIMKLRKKLDFALSGEEYKNALEWRFEFPEVLNAEGDFMGFDLIIGNPPYVVKKKIEYPQYKWNSDLYTMFFEMGFKIAKPNYYVNFITPRFWLVNESLQSMRKYFLEKVNLLSLSESNPFKLAKTENVIAEIQVCTSNQSTIKHYKETNEIFNFIDNVEKDIFAQNAKSEIIFNVDKNLIALFDKICKDTIPLKSIMQTKRGAEYGKNFVRDFRKGMKILCGGEVKAYSVEWNKTFIDSKLKDVQRLFDFFQSKDLIYLRRVDKRLSASMTSESYAFTKNIYGIKITNAKYNPKFILALLNSKLLNFYYLKRFTTKKEELFPEIQTYLYEQLPIPKLNAKNKKIADKIMNLVDKILQSKAKAQDSTTLPYPNATPPCHTTSHFCHTEALAEVSQKQKRDFSHSTNAQNDKIINDLESQIDKLVYQLYELDSHEIKIIESK